MVDRKKKVTTHSLQLTQLGGFFSADWFPLNIIIVSAIGSITYIIYHIISKVKESRKPKTGPGCRSDQHLCSSDGIDVCCNNLGPTCCNGKCQLTAEQCCTDKGVCPRDYCSWDSDDPATRKRVCCDDNNIIPAHPIPCEPGSSEECVNGCSACSIDGVCDTDSTVHPIINPQKRHPCRYSTSHPTPPSWPKACRNNADCKLTLARHGARNTLTCCQQSEAVYRPSFGDKLPICCGTEHRARGTNSSHIICGTGENSNCCPQTIIDGKIISGGCCGDKCCHANSCCDTNTNTCNANICTSTLPPISGSNVPSCKGIPTCGPNQYCLETDIKTELKHGKENFTKEADLNYHEKDKSTLIDHIPHAIHTQVRPRKQSAPTISPAPLAKIHNSVGSHPHSGLTARNVGCANLPSCTQIVQPQYSPNNINKGANAGESYPGSGKFVPLYHCWYSTGNSADAPTWKNDNNVPGKGIGCGGTNSNVHPQRGADISGVQLFATGIIDSKYSDLFPNCQGASGCFGAQWAGTALGNTALVPNADGTPLGTAEGCNTFNTSGRMSSAGPGLGACLCDAKDCLSRIDVGLVSPPYNLPLHASGNVPKCYPSKPWLKGANCCKYGIDLSTGACNDPKGDAVRNCASVNEQAGFVECDIVTNCQQYLQTHPDTGASSSLDFRAGKPDRDITSDKIKSWLQQPPN